MIRKLCLIFTILYLVIPLGTLAQTTEVALSIYGAPSLTLGGIVFSPLQTIIQSFSAFTAGSFSLTSQDGSSISILFSDQTTSVPVDFIVSSYSKSDILSAISLPAGLDIIGDTFYDLTAFYNQAFKTSFDDDFIVEFHYTSEQVTNFIEANLGAYSWDSSQGVWVSSFGSIIDQVNNTLSISIDHLTLFGIFGQIGVEEEEDERIAPRIEEGIAVLGLPAGSSVPPLPSSPVQELLRQIQADINQDNKIDILDFNMLIANWWKTNPNNPADINNDGVVDIFDFNLLMVDWDL